MIDSNHLVSAEVDKLLTATKGSWSEARGWTPCLPCRFCTSILEMIFDACKLLSLQERKRPTKYSRII